MNQRNSQLRSVIIALAVNEVSQDRQQEKLRTVLPTSDDILRIGVHLVNLGGDQMK
jgi:hypothetical protein